MRVENLLSTPSMQKNARTIAAQTVSRNLILLNRNTCIPLWSQQQNRLQGIPLVAFERLFLLRKVMRVFSNFCTVDLSALRLCAAQIIRLVFSHQRRSIVATRGGCHSSVETRWRTAVTVEILRSIEKPPSAAELKS